MKDKAEVAKLIRHLSECQVDYEDENIRTGLDLVILEIIRVSQKRWQSEAQ